MNLSKLINYKTIDDVFICGPEEMIHTVKDVLAEHGIASDRIHFELFKAAKPAEVEGKSGLSGKTQATITVDDETTTIEMSQKQTILEAALDEDIDAPYSCQGGICSSCLARIKEGSATMRQNNIPENQLYCLHVNKKKNYRDFIIAS